MRASFGVFAAGLAACCLPAVAHEPNESDCLEVAAVGDRWHIENRCDYGLDVSWCPLEDGGCVWKGKHSLSAAGTAGDSLPTGYQRTQPFDGHAVACRNDPPDYGGMWGTVDQDSGRYWCLDPLFEDTSQSAASVGDSICGLQGGDRVIVTVESVRTNHEGLRGLWRREGSWEARGSLWGNRTHTERDAWTTLFRETGQAPMPLPDSHFCAFENVRVEAIDANIEIVVNLRIYRVDSAAASTAGAMADSYGLD